MQRGASGRRESLQNLLVSLRAVARGARDFNCHVDIVTVQQAKLAALACHRSQVTRLDGSKDWLTLADVSDGEFLARLLGQREVFHRWQLA